MTEATVRGFRELARTVSPPGSYAVVDAQGRLVMGWLTEARAQEYQQYYQGAAIIEMAIWKGNLS